VTLDRRSFLRRSVAAAVAIAATPSLDVHAADTASPSAMSGVGSTGVGLTRIGSLYVPRLRANVWNMPIFDGVEDVHLNRGVGLIPGSVGPGEWGNFAIAGHRTKAVRPFYFVERLRRNDAVIVHNEYAWFTYRLIAQRIVVPQASWVLDPAPLPVRTEGETGTSRLLTIVTCTPRGTTEKRWVWWGRLAAVHPPDSRPAAIR
jgi:sortase A